MRNIFKFSTIFYVIFSLFTNALSSEEFFKKGFDTNPDVLFCLIIYICGSVDGLKQKFKRFEKNIKRFENNIKRIECFSIDKNGTLDGQFRQPEKYSCTPQRTPRLEADRALQF